MQKTHARWSPVTAFLVLGTAAVLAGCDLAVGGFSAEARDTWTKEYTLADGGRVEVENTNGFVEVEGASGSTVSVSAERVGRGGTDEAAREQLKRIQIREDVTPDRVSLRTQFEGGSGLFRRGGEVRYRLKVPLGATVRLVTTNGHVSVRGVSGPVDARTTNGAVTGSDLAGPVVATTTNGGIEIDVASLTGKGIELRTTNGGIDLRIPRDAKADLRAAVTNGGVSADGLDGMEVSERSRRRLQARLNGGGAGISLETTNGGIHIAGR